MEASLRALGLARSTLERRIGRGLRLFRDRVFDTMDLGHTGLGGLARSELGISGGQASELCRVADTLDRFPVLEQAWLRGEVASGHVLKLGHVMEPDTERGWVNWAREASVHETRKVVEAWRRFKKGEHIDEDGEDFEEVTFRGRPYVAHFLKIVGRDTVEKVVGHRLPMWRVVDYLCAEFSSGFPDLYPEMAEEEVRDLESVREREGIEVPDEEALRAAACATSETAEEAEAEGLALLPDPERAGSAEELLDILLALIGLRQSLDWQTGRILARCRGRFPHPERILGLSAGKARKLRSLDRRLQELPRLREAYRKGRIGGCKTWLLSRVCRRHTEGPWLEHAGEVSVRRLEAEVAGFEAMREIDPEAWRERTGGLPPDEALLEEWGVLPGGCKAPDLEAVANLRNGRKLEDLVLGPAWGKHRRFRGPPAVAEFFRATIRAVRKLLSTMDEGKCVWFLVEYYRNVYEQEAKALMGRHAALARDAGHCAFPDCGSRKPEGHHMEYQSRGGSDDPSNIESACGGHHRAGEHAGRLTIWGIAPNGVYIQAGRNIWNNDRRIRSFATVAEARAWARQQKRAFERQSRP